MELDDPVVAARAQGHRAIPMAKGVLEQVSQRPLELQAIRLDLGARRNVDLDAPAGRPRLCRVPGGNRVRQIRDVDALAAGSQLRVIEARDQQQILCNADQPVGLDGGRLDRGVQLVRRSLPAKRQLELGLQQRERRAQLVTGVGDKATFVREGLLEAGQHLVERLGETRISSRASGTGSRAATVSAEITLARLRIDSTGRSAAAASR